jgi:hypothetical protein
MWKIILEIPQRQKYSETLLYPYKKLSNWCYRLGESWGCGENKDGWMHVLTWGMEWHYLMAGVNTNPVCIPGLNNQPVSRSVQHCNKYWCKPLYFYGWWEYNTTLRPRQQPAPRGVARTSSAGCWRDAYRLHKWAICYISHKKPRTTQNNRLGKLTTCSHTWKDYTKIYINCAVSVFHSRKHQVSGILDYSAAVRWIN